MGLETAKSTDGSSKNVCGLNYEHAYSVISAFTMVDSEGNKHNVTLLRNPWGISNYNKTWSKDDTNWTDEMVK